MGLYDRDYGREYGDETAWDRHQRSQDKKPKSAAIILMIITVVVHFVDMMSTQTVETQIGSQSLGWLYPYFATFHDTALKPWTWYQFLTYGFLHDQNEIGHVLFNMVGLFFFGRAVEQKLGFDEFIRFYLLSMLAGGIAGCAGFWLMGIDQGSVVGASGAVLATTILFACYNPNAEILLMFVFPVKAWIVATFFVISNVSGALGIFGSMGGSTSFTVHLAGIAFGLLYYYQQWNFAWLDFSKLSTMKQRMSQRSRRMKLKIHDPDRKIENEASEADRILAKIHESGEESLTSSERKTLERYSRRQRERRQS
ncbi:rhomboid family intramembrane serine protease [Planctomycetes bacterium K23_9]|uniref:Rhomboid family protein n=1 Tax=Stieleria marina TaxID=1930275 RepID=A0A517NLS2_9BACT|nr:Rhomboid family protein [Planctomycetes bacterium K23_9]